MTTNLTPPPDRDLAPARRQAIRAVLGTPEPRRRATVPVLAAAGVVAVVGTAVAVPRLGDEPPAGGSDPRPGQGTVTQKSSPRTTPGSTKSTPDLSDWKPPTNPPASAVDICRSAQHNSPEAALPGPGGKVQATLSGRWGTTLILADGKYWVGCDTAGYKHNHPSLRRSATQTRPSSSDNDAFAVSEYMQSESWQATSKWYDYFWAAGILPADVGGVSYTFPDGKTQNAVVNGPFWLMQHSFNEPWREGTDINRPPIKVTLKRPNGSVLRSFELKWGTQTCAHVNHGC
jgi:hypothetical protein